MKKMTKYFLGGTQGKGNQMISWIHINDFNRAVEHVLNKREIEGVINIGAPNPVRNKDFMQKLRKFCKRPFGLPAPKALLEFGARIIKTETELILKSRFIRPEKLIQTGFEFHYPTVDSAMKDLVE
jgi:NAD dependent epimerase/dehydratase family enzyme